MLGEFRIQTKNVKNSADSYQDVHQAIEQSNNALEDVLKGLRKNVYGNLPRNLGSIIEKNERNAEAAKQLEAVLLIIVRKYQETENNIINSEEPEYLNLPFGEECREASEDYLGGGIWLGPDERGMLEVAWDYIEDSLNQALLGDFTEDGNLLGIALSIGIGFIPVVGQIADIRDLIADIYNLFDDGPETKEWVALAFTAVGFVPAIGDILKHTDEMAPLFRHLDNIVDGLGDVTKGAMKKGDEIFSAIMKSADDISDFVDRHVLEGVTSKVDDMIDGIPGVRDVLDKVSDVMKREIGDSDTMIGDVVSEFADGATEFTDHVQGWISDGIDFITGNEKENVGNGMPRAGAKGGFSFAFG